MTDLDVGVEERAGPEWSWVSHLPVGYVGNIIYEVERGCRAKPGHGLNDCWNMFIFMLLQTRRNVWWAIKYKPVLQKTGQHSRCCPQNRQSYLRAHVLRTFNFRKVNRQTDVPKSKEINYISPPPLLFISLSIVLIDYNSHIQSYEMESSRTKSPMF